MDEDMPPSVIAMLVVALLVLPSRALSQRALPPPPPALPVCKIEATVVGQGFIEGADVLVLPSVNTRQVLGWPDPDGAPATLHGLSTGASYREAVPWWIENDVAPPFAIQTRTDSRGYFCVDVPCVEGHFDERSWDAHPRIVIRATGYESVDMLWWNDASSRPITMNPEQVVRGQVVDTEGRPVEAALVVPRWLGSSNASPTGLARILPPSLLPVLASSDADGRFVLTGVRQWNSGLLVAHADFAPVSVDLPGSPQGRALPIHEAGTITLQRGVEVVGQVVDTSGAPLACAVVWTNPTRSRAYGYCPSISWQPDFDDSLLRCTSLGHESTIAVRADDDGRFRLRGVTADVSANAPDTRPLVDVQAIAPGHDVGYVLDVDLSSDARLDTTVMLRRDRRIDLRVVDDATGQPIAEARVSATVLMWPSGWRSGTLTPVCDGPGGFILDHAGRHETLVWANASGHGPAVAAVRNLADGETRAIEVRLPIESVLTGRVTTTTGTPVANARVNGRAGPAGIDTYEGRDWGGFDVVTDTDGRWRVEGLAGTIRHAWIEHNGYATAWMPETPLLPGETCTFDAKLEKAASVLARWPEGWPAGRSRGHWIALEHDPPTDELYRRPVGQDRGEGRLFPGLSSGRYQLQATGCEPVTILLAEGEQREVSLVAQTPPTLAGQVLSGGKPLAGLMVTGLRLEGPDSRSPYAEGTWTSEDGRFELHIPYAGSWRARVERSGLVAWSEALDLPWGSEVQTTIDIPVTRWLITALDSDLKPLAGATFYFIDDFAQVKAAFTTDDLGVATLEGVPTGSHRVALRDPATASRSPVVLELPPEAADGSRSLRLVVPRLAAISGSVAGEANRNPRFRVRVLQLDDPRHGEPFRESPTDLVATVFAGSYDIAGLAPGAYRVLLESETGPVAMSASAKGRPPWIWWPHATRDVTLGAGEQRTVDFAP